MTEEQFKAITDWQKETFKEATALSKTTHLQQEVKELITDLAASTDRGIPVEGLDLLEPVPFPTSCRDGYGFRQHVAEGNLEGKRLEFADNFILLFGAANSYGITYHEFQNSMSIAKHDRQRYFGLYGTDTALQKVKLLEKEVEELAKALQSGDDEAIRVAFAECFLLLFGAAYSDIMSFDDVCYAIDEKMKINYNRQWGKPDANGVVNHIV